MRRPRLQYGGVYLDKRYGIWYYRRSIDGKRQLQPIGKLADYPTKAKAKLAAQDLVVTENKPKGITFETAALAYMAGKRWPKHHPPRKAIGTTWKITASRAGVAWNCARLSLHR